MKHTSIGLLGSVALSLLANQALAIQIVSTSTQSGRIEGQSVAVSAGVDWEETGGVTIINPLLRTTRTVTATIAGITSDQPSSITLTLDSSTGLYQGAFADLPAGSFSVVFTATRTIVDARKITSTTTTRASANASRSVNVALPAGCFLFQNQSLQGFTARGFFNADTSTIVTQANFNPQWISSFGVLNANSSDGSFFLNLQGAQPPAANQVNGFYRFDVVSPDLSTNSAWQGVTGVSFRYEATQLGALNLHAVLHVRKADGTTALFTQFNSDGTPLTSAAFTGSFQTMVDHVALPTGSTVTGVDVRVFGQPGNILPSLMFDAICPRH